MDAIITVALSPPQAHLVVRGELDAFAALPLHRRLEEAIDTGCTHFRLDLSEVSFIDAGGLGALVRLGNLVAPGGTVTVVAASPRYRKVAEIAGLGRAFGLDLLPAQPERTGDGAALSRPS